MGVPGSLRNPEAGSPELGGLEQPALARRQVRFKPARTCCEASTANKLQKHTVSLDTPKPP